MYGEFCYNRTQSEDQEDSYGLPFLFHVTYRKGGEFMSTMEILTLLLVVFAALTYLDSHKK